MKDKQGKNIRAERIHRFGIRKLSMGVASIAIASGLLFLGQPNVAEAAEWDDLIVWEPLGDVVDVAAEDTWEEDFSKAEIEEQLQEAKAEEAAAAENLATAKAELQEQEALKEDADKNIEKLEADVAASKEAAKEQIKKGSKGFFEAMDAKEALQVFTEEKTTSDGSSYLKATQVGEEDDATSLENMKASLPFLQKNNDIRKEEGGIDGRALVELKVTDFDMAVAQHNANWSKDKSHSKAYNPPYENLSWGYQDPFEGWFYEECEAFKQLQAKGFTSREEMDNYLSKNPIKVNGSPITSVGHYTNLVDHLMWPAEWSKKDSASMGYAYRPINNEFGRVDSIVLNPETTGQAFTVAEYTERFNNYYKLWTEQAAEGSKESRQALEDAKKNSQLDLAEFEEKVKQAKEAKALADEKVANLKKQLEDITEAKPELMNIDHEALEVDSGGTTEFFRILGQNLTKDVLLKTEQNEQVVEEGFTIASIEGKGGYQKLSLQAPKNKMGKDAVYTVHFSYDEDFKNSVSLQVTVKASEAGGDEEEQPETSTTAKAEYVTPDAPIVESGKTKEVTVFGQDMTDDLQLFAMHKGERVQGFKIVSVSGAKKTSKTVIIQAPENKTEQQIIYDLYLGYGDEEALNSRYASLTLTVLPDRSEAVDPGEVQPDKKPELMNIDHDALEVDSGSTTEAFRILGQNLTKDVLLKTEQNEQVVEEGFTIASINGKGGYQELTLQAPENETDKDAVYTVHFSYDEDFKNSVSLQVMVKASDKEEGNEEKPEPGKPGGGETEPEEPGDKPTPELPDEIPESDLPAESLVTVANVTTNGGMITLHFKEEVESRVKNLADYIGFIDEAEQTVDTKIMMENLSGKTWSLLLSNKIATDGSVKIQLPKGLFQTKAGDKINAATVMAVQAEQAAKITGYELKKDVLGAEGGEVEVRIQGENLKADSERVYVTVTAVGQKARADLNPQITYEQDGADVLAKIKFDENDSQAARSYRLNFFYKAAGLEQEYRRELETNRGDRPVVTLMGQGMALDTPVITHMAITSYETNQDGDQSHTTVSDGQGSKKTQTYIYGANLDELTMDVYAVDQFGRVWPVVPSQNDDTLKRILTGNSGVPNGFVGGGTFMVAEIILPNQYDQQLTFTYHFAPDGQHYIEDTVSATVNPPKIGVPLKEKTVTIKHVDQATQKVIAEDTVYESYELVPNPFKEADLQIAGYELVNADALLKAKQLQALPNEIVLEYQIKEEKPAPGTEPEEPTPEEPGEGDTDPEKPGDGDTDPEKPGEGDGETDKPGEEDEDNDSLKTAKEAAKEELKLAGIGSDFWLGQIDKVNTVEGVNALKDQILASHKESLKEAKEAAIAALKEAGVTNPFAFEQIEGAANVERVNYLRDYFLSEVDLSKAKEDAKNEIYKLQLDQDAVTKFTTEINEVETLAEINKILEEAKKYKENSEKPDVKQYIGGIVDETTGTVLADFTSANELQLLVDMKMRLDGLKDEYKFVRYENHEENGVLTRTAYVKPVEKEEIPASPLELAMESFTFGIIDEESGVVLKDKAFKGTRKDAREAFKDLYMDLFKEGKYEFSRIELNENTWTVYVKEIKGEDTPMIPLEPAIGNFKLGIILRQEGKVDETLVLENFKGTEAEANEKLLDLYMDQVKAGYHYVKTIKGEGNNWAIVVAPAEKEEETPAKENFKLGIILREEGKLDETLTLEDFEGTEAEAEAKLLDLYIDQVKNGYHYVKTIKGEGNNWAIVVSPAEQEDADEKDPWDDLINWDGLKDEKDPWKDLINWEGLKDLDDKSWNELINWEGIKDLINKGEKPGKDWDDIFDWEGIKDLVENNQKPGEKPGKDWNDLIDWDKLKDLLNQGNEGQKPGEGETQEPETSEDKTLALEVKELDKWVKYADSLKKMTIDVHNALDEAKAVLAKADKTYAEVHKALEKLFFALEDANLLPKEGNAGQKPGTGGQETEKPGKDWNNLIDWNKLKELLAKKGDKKPGKQEEVKTGKKEEAKKGKKEEAKKLPQTGAVASLGSAALGLALTTLGAGFAFRKRQ